MIKGIFIILIVSLTIGCLSTDSAKKYASSPEALVDSASVKVDVADRYIQEGKEGKVENVLVDAQEDVVRAIKILNTSLREEEVNALSSAAKNIAGALDFLINGEFDGARKQLDLATKELELAGILLLGKTDRAAPERFTVTDEEIPITYYGEVDGVYIGYQVVPHNVAKAAREAFYSYSITDDEDDLNRGLFLTEYLISVSSERGNGRFVVWENNFEWPGYALPKGWIGALSQAGCIKALMLASDATGDGRYEEFAEKAIAAFDVDVSEGGLRSVRIDGAESYDWYPEYAKSDPPYVLNGFITSVIWLGDYYTLTGNAEAKALYDEGVKSVIHFLPAYEYGNQWSYYDAAGHKSNSHYHELHVEQLAVLYDLTGDSIFRTYQDKWSSRIE